MEATTRSNFNCGRVTGFSHLSRHEAAGMRTNQTLLKNGSDEHSSATWDPATGRAWKRGVSWQNLTF